MREQSITCTDMCRVTYSPSRTCHTDCVRGVCKLEYELSKHETRLDPSEKPPKILKFGALASACKTTRQRVSWNYRQVLVYARKARTYPIAAKTDVDEENADEREGTRKVTWRREVKEFKLAYERL